MHYIITFNTSKFDMTREDENCINPIYGQSLLVWLKNKVSATVQLDEPDTEDWGWYSTIDWKCRSYLLGASAAESDLSDYEWVFQVDKQRTFSEKLLGKNKMTKDDECLLFFKAIFDAEPEFKNVTIE